MLKKIKKKLPFTEKACSLDVMTTSSEQGPLATFLSTITVPRRYYTSPAIVLVAALAVAQGPVNAGDDGRFFDLPVQSLAQALIEFALQSSTSIIVPSHLLENQMASPVIGKHTTEGALTLLLGRSDLTFRYSPKQRRIAVYPKPSPALPVTAAKADSVNPSINMTEVVVTGRRFPHRYTTITSSQVYSGLSIYDSTRFFSVLAEPLIDDQAPLELASLLRNSSSITPADGMADSNDDYYVRGFPRNALYWQGFRLDPQLGTKMLPGLFAQAEILKGPSTLRYGQAEPGGIVNLVPKTPNLESYQQLHTRIGPDGYRLGLAELDQGGDNIKARLVAGVEQFETMKDHADGRKDVWLPSASLTIGDHWRLDATHLHQKTQHRRDQGRIVFAPVGDAVDVFALADAAEQANTRFSADLALTTIDLSWLSDTWQARGRLFRLSENQSGIRGDDGIFASTQPLVKPGDVNPGPAIIVGEVPLRDRPSLNNGQSIAAIQSLHDESADLDNHALALIIEGSPTLLGQQHHLAIGIDQYHQDSQKTVTLQTLVDTATGATLPSSRFTDRSQTLSSRDTGLWLQDSVDLSDRWSVSAGARYWHASATLRNQGTRETLPELDETALQLGGIWRLNDTYSVFTNYSEGLKPNYVIDDVGSVIDKPERSTQYEMGIKFLTHNFDYSGTIAAYNIAKENIVDVQIWDGVRHAFIQAEQTVNGIDIDLTYQPAQPLSVVFAGSLLNAEVTQGNFAGKKPAHVASHTASLFMQYRPVALNNAFRMSLGVYNVGDRYSDDANTLILDGFNTTDMGIAYHTTIGGIDITVDTQLKNIFNTDYAASSAGYLRTNRGMGRTLLGGLTLKL